MVQLDDFYRADATELVFLLWELFLQFQQKSIEVKTDLEANGKRKISEESGGNYEKEEQLF
ncbi:hypothetical protein V1226_13600 [Lachnospiraceae bacterium JLR.KK009]